MRIFYYLLDAHPGSTSSLGLLNLSIRLLEALASLPGPRILVLCTPDLAQRLPKAPRVRIITVPWPNHSLAGRLLADHAIQPLFTWILRANVLFAPKGWLSIWPFRQWRTIANISDIIVFQLHDRYGVRGLKNFYFRQMTRWAYRLAHHVTTISKYSASELRRMIGHQRTLSTYPLGTGTIAKGSPIPSASLNRSGLLIQGSIHPHKEVRSTLMMLRRIAEQQPWHMPITVTSLSRWPDAWGAEPHWPFPISFTGHLSDADLTLLYDRSQCLILPSPCEGFGLPAVEAYARHCPVAYRDEGGLGEVLLGLPGAFGESGDSLCAAIVQVCSLPAETIADIRSSILRRYNWRNSALVINSVLDKELSASSQ